MKVLVIEDDAETAAYIVRGLREHGHVVDHAADGQDGLFLAAGGRPRRAGGGPDAAGPRRAGPGPHLARRRREGAGAVPDRLAAAWATGCRGWRPAATTTWSSRSPSPSCWRGSTRWPAGRRCRTCRRRLRVADLELDLLRRTVTRGGERVELQPREFRLLEFLLRHADRVVTRTMLLEGVWDFHFDPRTNIVETHISRLRGKLSRGGRDPELIHTVRGSGYVLRAPGA